MVKFVTWFRDCDYRATVQCFCHIVCGVLEDERAGPRGSRADSGGGAGARERDGRTAARQDRGEDV